MIDKEKVIKGLEVVGNAIVDGYIHEPGWAVITITDAIALLKEQEARILSLREAIEGKNGLEIDPYVFVEIKGREDIFIGSVSDLSHYNYPDFNFGVRECFQINRDFPASKIYLNTDYMKIVRCWTHKPSKKQREAVKWDD